MRTQYDGYRSAKSMGSNDRDSVNRSALASRSPLVVNGGIKLLALNIVINAIKDVFSEDPYVRDEAFRYLLTDHAQFMIDASGVFDIDLDREILADPKILLNVFRDGEAQRIVERWNIPNDQEVIS